MDKKYTCNQCGKQILRTMGCIKIRCGDKMLPLAVCYNPKCPNYALWQVSMERMMDKMKLKEKQDK